MNQGKIKCAQSTRFQSVLLSSLWVVSLDHAGSKPKVDHGDKKKKNTDSFFVSCIWFTALAVGAR